MKTPPKFRRPGIERRAQLLKAARRLLGIKEINQISLGDVAKAARIPKSSAYHFYTDIMDLYVHLLAEVDRQLLAALAAPLRKQAKSWQEIVSEMIRRGVKVYATDAAARQLVLNPRTPHELKLRDRRNDISLGKIFEFHIAANFVLPTLRNRRSIFFRAVEIADLMFCLSVLEHGRITPLMAAEAERAAIAYLEIYLRPHLPRLGMQQPQVKRPARS